MDLGHHSPVPHAERHAVDGSRRPLRGWMDGGAMVDGGGAMVVWGIHCIVVL